MVTTITAFILELCEYIQALLQYHGKKDRFKIWHRCILVCNKTFVCKNIFYIKNVSNKNAYTYN